MKVTILKGALASLACLGMAIPSTVMADAKMNQVASKVQIADVALNNGVMSGKVVDTQGQNVNGGVVKVSLGSKVVASAVTDANGEFAINDLKSGLYQVSSGESQSVVRLWDGQVAPPAAKSNVLIVQGNTVRAQCDSPTDYVILGTAITGVALGGAALAQGDGDTIIVSP
ncbi:carboxypeptidase-like regulatory domain-containing protein [Rubinisphaera margarita]|uniref:carboxypeptidase-like regulatory domain-containing protein n=1 Tax=Rubinisphaera margarita TaxID=2909586 RepID=UPI001EE81387|nr:carboxypeptidase-like regulatory domain-containing protein [Rubinisphaera margarita]MCG6155816.1 carboxypeptidase-like regulatory domain-containing protein [Rubinisphaera margarita]